MISQPTCVICGGIQWRQYRTYSFSRASHAARVNDRVRILFDVWCPDSSTVSITEQACNICGFVTLAPRASEADVDGTYAWFANNGLDTPPPQGAAARVLDEQRARRLHGLLSPWLPCRQLTILDVGGGDGRLLLPFARVGHRCSVVDYSPETVPGVRKLGNTLADLSAPDFQVDLILCSHVVEHLASPDRMLVQLRSNARADTLLYVEVPHELIGGLPVATNPTMHVNFFTSLSLQLLMINAGWAPQMRRENLSTYGHHPIRTASILARPGVGDPDFERSRNKTRCLLAKSDAGIRVERARRALFLLSRLLASHDLAALRDALHAVAPRVSTT